MALTRMMQSQTITMSATCYESKNQTTSHTVCSLERIATSSMWKGSCPTLLWFCWWLRLHPTKDSFPGAAFRKCVQQVGIACHRVTINLL